jgi:hypothetical protein
MTRAFLLVALTLAACDNSPTMDPGSDCLSCHSPGGRAHRAYSVAGTVFAQPDSPEFDGVAGANVVVTDANGRIVTMTTNAAGNFYTEEDVTLPLDVLVQVGDIVRHMEPRVTKASCGSCHEAVPYQGTEGRVFIGTNLHKD